MKSQYLKQIIECLTGYLGIEDDVITADSRLTADLGLSSFDLIELVCDMEEKFRITITPRELINVISVKDLEDMILGKKERTDGGTADEIKEEEAL